MTNAREAEPEPSITGEASRVATSRVTRPEMARHSGRRAVTVGLVNVEPRAVSHVNVVRQALEKVHQMVLETLPDIEALRTSITWKPDGSPVTEADVLVERGVEALLREILGDITFHGEETFEEGMASQMGWMAVLDPIDGTENFCSGLKVWGLSLSIWHDRAHVGSMLMLPELKERLITGDSIQHFSSRITGFSSSISDDLVAQLAGAGEARISGCAVFNMMNVVRGTFRRFVNPVGAYSWDLLAGVQLALEHGCEVEIDGSSYAGTYLEPGRRYRVDIRHRPDRDSG